MEDLAKQDLLRQLPSISDLLGSETAVAWLAEHPRSLVTSCIRDAVERVRNDIQTGESGQCGQSHVTAEYLLNWAGWLLVDRIEPHVRGAINATGIILHTALGRAAWPAKIADALAGELKGYVTLAIDRETGQRSERDRRIEYILRELTGAEAATVVNNNAAATLLVLAALSDGKETIVSRGQLVEIGGAFRLPDVMSQSGAKMVEVGTTNRTHLKDYAEAITEESAVLLRVHPSNYRVLGFTKEVALEELVALGRSKWLTVVDDLGAGAMVGLEQFGLPHEPTVSESIEAGADVVLFSADKLIGAAQGGVIVGRAEIIERIRKHPLARALRADKSCLMVLERTLHLFRDLDLLRREHPLYMMLSTSSEELKKRALELAASITESASKADAKVDESIGYLGSGSLPTEAMPTFVVRISVEGMEAGALAKNLRLDPACVFGRVENEKVVLDVRTIWDEQIAQIAEAMQRITET